MGKAALIGVAAVILAGSFLLLNLQQITGDTNRTQGQQQSDILARELARTGHNLVLAYGVSEDGFNAGLPFKQQLASGGEIHVIDYNPSPDGTLVDFTVQGHYGGTVHQVRSRYRWNLVTFPSPLWMEGPNQTASLSPKTVIDGGKKNYPVVFDDAVFENLGMDELGLSFNGIVRNFMDEVSNSSSQNVWEEVLNDNKREKLEKNGTPPLETIYHAILSYPGLNLVSNPSAFSGEFGTKKKPVVLLADGDAVVNGSVKGHGILVVEGGLSVPVGSTFEWDGFVLMSPGESASEANLAGKTQIDGAMALLQEGVPPGGHMDVTSFRDYTGSWSDPWGSTYWMLKHTHKYNEKQGDTVFFTGNAAAGRPERLNFTETLQSLGSRDVYLEIGNHRRHGLSQFVLDVDGHGPVSGPIVRGFGDLASAVSSYRSQTFKANELNDFEISVRSLSMLQKMWDELGGCQDGPRCVSASYTREGALTVSLREDGTDKLVYQASVYWHRRLDEVAEHEQQMEAWRQSILSGQDIGFKLTMGDAASIRYDKENLNILSQVLAADALALKHLGTWEQHWAPGEKGNPLKQKPEKEKDEKNDRYNDDAYDDDVYEESPSVN